MELRKTSIHQAVEAVQQGEITAFELIEKTLKNCSVLDEGLNIFNSIAGIDALEQAKAIDQKNEKGGNLPLAGIPVAVKDDLCYGVLPTSLGSAAFNEFMSPVTAAAVERLMDAGAVVIGKTNLDDMGQGSTTLSSPGGPTVNPWQAERTAGSAGAAAVATGICMFALESDSGGAQRQGASHCGVVGLRPTTGRVSRYGLNTHCSSFARVGITAFSCENIAGVLDILSGFDERDAATAVCREGITEISKIPNSDKLTIGYPVNAFDFLEPELREVFEKARDEFAERGYKIAEIDLGLLREGLQAYYVIALIEASSNHARFDGIRFGKTGESEILEEMYQHSRAEILGKEARRRSIFGTYLLSKGNYDQYYRQALKVWKMVRQEFKKAFDQCDLLMLPAAKKLPRLLNEEYSFLDEYFEDLFCAPVSLSGMPALTVPAGQVNQLPVGMQLVGPPFSEKTLLALGSWDTGTGPLSQE